MVDNAHEHIFHIQFIANRAYRNDTKSKSLWGKRGWTETELHYRNHWKKKPQKLNAQVRTNKLSMRRIGFSLWNFGAASEDHFWINWRQRNKENFQCIILLKSELNFGGSECFVFQTKKMLFEWFIRTGCDHPFRWTPCGDKGRGDWEMNLMWDESNYIRIMLYFLFSFRMKTREVDYWLYVGSNFVVIYLASFSLCFIRTMRSASKTFTMPIYCLLRWKFLPSALCNRHFWTAAALAVVGPITHTTCTHIVYKLCIFFLFFQNITFTCFHIFG